MGLQTFLISGESFPFPLFGVDQLQPHPLVFFAAAQLASAAQVHGVLSGPDHLAVLKEDEVTAVPVDQF